MSVVSKSINWNSAVWNQAVDAVTTTGGWTKNVPSPDPEHPGAMIMIPNPVGKVQFFNKWLKAQATNVINENNNRIALAAVEKVTDTEG